MWANAAITTVSISEGLQRMEKNLHPFLHVYSFLNQQVLARCRMSQTGRLGRRIISGEEVGHAFIPTDAVSEGDSQPLWKGPEMRTCGPDKGQETTAQAFCMPLCGTRTTGEKTGVRTTELNQTTGYQRHNLQAGGPANDHLTRGWGRQGPERGSRAS